MEEYNCIRFYLKKIMLGAIFIFGCTIVLTDTLIGSSIPERYDVIISRSPFGVITYDGSGNSSTNMLGTELSQEQIEIQEQLAKEAEILSKNIKLTAITTYQGVPAAMITELSSRRTFYLLKGQSILGYTLTDIAENSILLETTNAIANITMSYAPGQPSEITIHPISGRLTPLNVFFANSSPTNSVVIKQQTHIEQSGTDSLFGEDGEELPDEVIEAATVVDADGTERISFRELHRLRMEEQKKKLEEERIAREQRELEAQRAREEQALREQELEQIIVAEEQLLEAESFEMGADYTGDDGYITPDVSGEYLDDVEGSYYTEEYDDMSY